MTAGQQFNNMGLMKGHDRDSLEHEHDVEIIASKINEEVGKHGTYCPNTTSRRLAREVKTGDCKFVEAVQVCLNTPEARHHHTADSLAR